MHQLLFLVAFLFAQQPQAEQPKRPALEGVILQEGTGQPVPKATVTLMRAGASEMNPPKVEATQEGAFRFDELTPGTYIVSAERNGFARRAYGAKNDGALRGIPIRLSMGDTRKIELRLFKQSVISGKVLDTDGEPLQGVIVVALRPAYQRGKKLWVPAGQATSQTSDTGEFRVSGLPNGKFLVCAMPLRLISGTGMGSAPPSVGPSGKPESSVFTCYPSVTERANATAVEVADGAEVPGVTIQLAKRVVSRVRGQMTGLPANVAQIIPLSLAPKGSGVSGMMFSNRALVSGADGKFDFLNVTPGSYVLHTLPTGLGASTLAVKMPLEVTEDAIDGLAVPVATPMELPGAVVIDGKEEVTGMESARLVLTAEDDVYSTIPMSAIKANGQFTLPGVTADRYTVTVAGLPEKNYVKSVRYGDKSSTDNTVEVTTPVAPFTIVVGDDAATVVGTVRDAKGEPAQGAYVVVVDKAQRRGRNRVARADEKGNFRVTGVEPGDYAAFAAPDVDGGAIDDPEYVKPWMSKAVAVKATPGSQPAVSLVME